MTKSSYQQHDIKLELLGIGSAKDRKMRALLEEALRRIGYDIPIQEVRAIKDLMRYDISGIPALTINNQVIFQKEIPRIEELTLAIRLAITKVDPQYKLRNILVPTDFSDTASNAYAFALKLAQRDLANIHLLNVHQPTVEVGNAFQLDPDYLDYSSQERRLREFSQSTIENHLPRKGKNLQVKIQREVRSGAIVEEIKTIGQEKQTDMIIMGTTGQGGFLNKLFGSISSEVARKAHCPVLLIPRHAQFSPFKRIVYASAQQPAEEGVWSSVLQLATYSNAELHFAHITPNIVDGFEVRECAIHVPAGAKNVEVHIASVESKDVLEGLSQYIEEINADLLIMATTHRNFLEALFHRSLTKQMVFHTTVPLMILHY